MTIWDSSQFRRRIVNLRPIADPPAGATHTSQSREGFDLFLAVLTCRRRAKCFESSGAM